MLTLSDLAGRSVLVWGAGLEGKAAAAAARSAGAASVAMLDEPPSGPVLRTDDGEQPTTTYDAVRSADVVIRSPGVRPYRPELAEHPAVITGTSLWLATRGGTGVVGCTGSKGKSTTASLTAALLEGLGREVVLAGNVGRPLLDVALDAPLVVAEVSSYQAAGAEVSPEVGVLTALFPDHVNWHGSVERYYRDKLQLFRPGCSAGLLANGEDARVRELAADLPGVRFVPDAGAAVDEEHLLLDGEPLLERSALRLPGRHNAVNACLAVAAVRALEPAAGREALAAALRGFAPLAHRLEVVRDDGRTWVDDGLATTPEACVAAARAFPDRDLVVLVGGADRGLDYSGLVEFAAQRGRVRFLALPDSGVRIAAALRERDVPVQVCSDLDEAMGVAAELAAPGSVVLLSPAAPSFGRFVDYRERSAVFRRAVESL